MNNRVFFKIGIIVILVALAAGGILAWQFLWTPKEEIKAPEKGIVDETANWKTYKNEKYGYEIKYPADWYLNEWPDKHAVGFRTYSPDEMPQIDDSLINIEIEQEYSSIDDWINEFKTTTEEGMESWGMNFFQEEIMIGNEKGYKIGFVGEENGQKAYLFVSIVLYRDGNVFIFQQSSPIECQRLECKIFNQMLSTFKFIETKITDEKQEIEPAKIEDVPSAELSRNDIWRIANKKIIMSALYSYFEDYNEYPQTLKKLLDIPPGKTYPYLQSNKSAEDILKDPATKEFYEYHPGVSDYQLCINYDKTGRQCYTSKDF
mgnify:CR=1 FL=1